MFPQFNRREFWSNPRKASRELKEYQNGKFYTFTQPEFYLKQNYSSKIIAKYIPKYTKPDWSLLEYGCNTGKCIAMLIRDFGYIDITGVEINKHAIELGRENFPELSKASIICLPLEDCVNDLPEYDCVYGNGVFMHLPYELNWVIETLANKAKKVFFTSENEVETSFHKFARNYKTFLEPLGWKQVEEESGANFPPLPKSTIIRVFVRE